LEPRFLSFVS